MPQTDTDLLLTDISIQTKCSKWVKERVVLDAARVQLLVMRATCDLKSEGPIETLDGEPACQITAGLHRKQEQKRG